MANILARPLAGLGPRARLATAALLGAVAGLGQAPVSVPWISLLALLAVFRVFEAGGTQRQSVLTGWAVGTGYFALTLSWMVEPFLVDIARHGWMAPFALLFAAFGFSLFWALAFGLAWRFSRPGWRRALLWALALSGAEMLRSYVMTGFPWALIGHVWIGWAPMQLAAWIGPHGLTLFTLLAVVGAAIARSWLARAAVVLAFAAIYAFGFWQAGLPVPGSDATRPVVRLIQPNAAQHLKWDPAMAPQFFARQLALTATPSDVRPDLVIWPETAVPYLLDEAGAAFERIAEAAAGVPVVLGIQRIEDGQAFNSLALLDSAGRVAALYDKYHLVPFGEYIPAGWLLERLGLGALATQQGFSAGPGPRLLNLGPLGRALPLICYEVIFPQGVFGAPERPDWLLQITNDAWFGKVSGPYQHLAQARLRAVEAGLPMLRAANTGVSAVIDARGHVTASLDLGQAGYLDGVLPPPLPRTLYARTGDLPFALFLAMAAAAVFLQVRRKSD